MLETLLANVPLEDFLHRPTKQQQKRAQASPTSVALPEKIPWNVCQSLHTVTAGSFADILGLHRLLRQL